MNVSSMNGRSLVLMASLGVLLACQSPSGGHGADRGTLPPVAETAADTVPSPERVEILFGDSSNRTLFWDQESVVEVVGKELRVDGLSLVYISTAGLPLRIQTSLMHIDVLALPLLVQFDAYNKDAGQSLDVFSGALKVGKSYESPFPDSDTLRAGDLYMINKDIDLSEKERLDDFSMLRWWKETYSKEFCNAVADSTERYF